MSLDKIITNLYKIYPTQTDKINELKQEITILKQTNDKNKISEKLETLQEIINQLYNIKSSDELIELQVIINEYRYKYDITDPIELIYIDNGKGFVQ